MAAPAGGGGARRSGRPKPAPAPDMLRPAVPSEAPGVHQPISCITWEGCVAADCVDLGRIVLGRNLFLDLLLAHIIRAACEVTDCMPSGVFGT